MGVGIDRGHEVAAHSFTPVRRPQSSVNTRTSLLGEKEWTANRCHRLLRPLTSRIAILDRELSRFPCAAQICKRQRDSEPVAVSKDTLDVEDSQASDAEWTQPARKRIRRTYSARGGRKDKDSRGSSKGFSKAVLETQASAPGEILIPTPILNRTREMKIDTAAVLHPDGKHLATGSKRLKSGYLTQDAEAYLQLFELRRTIAPSRYSTYEGIYTGLEALLRATELGPPERLKTGARSLFLTCLKTTPRYIAEEQELISAQAEESGCKSAIDERDVSSEIYNELEAFGVSNLGWKHLKTVVRSHGIQIICEAIQRGLLDVQFCGALVTLCVQTTSPDAAESILSSTLSVSQITSPKSIYSRFTDDPNNIAVSIMWKYVGYTGRASYHYRQLSSMFAERSIPLYWLATKEFGKVWTGVIQSLSSASENVDASLFLHTVLPLLAMPDCVIRSNDEGHAAMEHKELAEALQQTYASVLTTIATIAILSKETASQYHVEDSGSNCESPASHFDRITTLLQHCLTCYRLSNSGQSSNGTLLLASLLVIVSHRTYEPLGSRADLADLLLEQLQQDGESHGSSNACSALATFICSIARCCGRGTSTAGLEYIQEMHRILESSASTKASGSEVLFEAIVDSAFAFSQQALDRQHLCYAERISAKYHCIGTQTSQKAYRGYGSSNTGYRWEEGISEWVTATPAANMKKSKSFEQNTASGESECDTPFRKPIYRRTNMEKMPQDAGPRVIQTSRYTSVLQNPEDRRGGRFAEDAGGSDDLKLDESFTSDSSQQTSSQNTRSARGVVNRRPVNRKMGYAKRTLQILVEDSDDELSFQSSTSQEDMALQTVTNLAQSRRRRRSCQTRSKIARCKAASRWRASILEDSEDELCS